MFKKNPVLKYRFIDDKYNEDIINSEVIKRILEKSYPKTCPWWKSLPRFIEGFTSYLEYLKAVHTHIADTGEQVKATSISTAKTCPGVIGILDKAFLVKAPSDLYITVRDDDTYIVNSADDLISVTHHEPNQFDGYDSALFKDKIALKISIKVYLRLEGADDYLLVAPTYHNNLPGSFAPGFINKHFKHGQELNIIYLVDKPQEGQSTVFNIKAGDVLAYLIPSAYDVGLEFSEHNFMLTARKGCFTNRLSYK